MQFEPARYLACATVDVDFPGLGSGLGQHTERTVDDQRAVRGEGQLVGSGEVDDDARQVSTGVQLLVANRAEEWYMGAPPARVP